MLQFFKNISHSTHLFLISVPCLVLPWIALDALAMTAEVVHDCLLELSQEAKGRNEHSFSIGSKCRGASISIKVLVVPI